VTAPLNAHEWEAAAAASLPDASAAYLFGGAEDERTLRSNREAFERIGVRPRILAGFSAADLRTTVLGTESSMPILVAPVGHQRLFHADGEVGTARAAAAAGTIFALSTMANATIEEVAEVGGPRWFQLYALQDRGHRRELVARAEAAGYTAVVLTVDVQSLGHRERDLRAGFHLPEWLEMPLLVRSREGDLTLHQTSAMLDPALSYADLEEVCGWTSLPAVVKGVLRPDDAVRCAEHGAAGIVVSNHGGRQLDGAIASVDALPAIADEAGDDLEVLLDSGVRRGVDVLAALALGARAVLVGRPVISALAMDGEDGVAAVLAQLRDELSLAMHLSGCRDVADISRDLIA
jgi:isopentenyl diphosphate isomerase/L-lactate dehydrogenase-like FMN-dependent dehydrogenase